MEIGGENRTLNELRIEIENIIMATIAEWENRNNIIIHHRFEIKSMELITDNLKVEGHDV